MAVRTRVLFVVKQLATLGFLVALVLGVLVPASPRFQKAPGGDSGIFLYTGWRVTEGALPYRDVWDHKPPLIFVVDALGIGLSGGSRWGVWGLEVVSLLVAAWFAFRLFQRAFGLLPAVYASFAWIVNSFVVMDGGNYTTEYALPLQFAFLYVFATAPTGTLSLRRAFTLGILSGLLFWMKQNDIGLPLALVLYLLIEFLFRGARRVRVESLMGLSAGALLVTVIVILPFAVQGALPQFWDAAFLFNFVYIQESWIDRLVILRYVPVFLPLFGMVLFAVIGWLVAVLAFGNGIRNRTNLWSQWGDRLAGLLGEDLNGNPGALTRDQTLQLVALVVLALPIELFLVSISGNPFDHYFLALLPVFGVLAAFTFRLVLAMLERVLLTRAAVSLFTAGLVLTLLLFSAESVQTMWQRISQREPDPIVNYILQTTAATDKVYMWSSEAGLLFETKRRAPTRFIYLAPVQRKGYRDEAKISELLTDLITGEPRLIIVPTKAQSDFLQFSIQSPQLAAQVAQIRSAYAPSATVDAWTIYERRAP